MLSGLAIERFEMGEIAVQLSCVGTEKGIAFSHLRESAGSMRCHLPLRGHAAYLYLRVRPKEHSFQGLHDDR